MRFEEGGGDDVGILVIRAEEGGLCCGDMSLVFACHYVQRIDAEKWGLSLVLGF